MHRMRYLFVRVVKYLDSTSAPCDEATDANTWSVSNDRVRKERCASSFDAVDGLHRLHHFRKVDWCIVRATFHCRCRCITSTSQCSTTWARESLPSGTTCMPRMIDGGKYGCVRNICVHAHHNSPKPCIVTLRGKLALSAGDVRLNCTS